MTAWSLFQTPLLHGMHNNIRQPRCWTLSFLCLWFARKPILDGHVLSLCRAQIIQTWGFCMHTVNIPLGLIIFNGFRKCHYTRKPTEPNKTRSIWKVLNGQKECKRPNQHVQGSSQWSARHYAMVDKFNVQIMLHSYIFFLKVKNTVTAWYLF